MSFVSSRNWQLRVQDILTAIVEIQQRTIHITFEDFEQDKTLVKAVLYDFIIIGEATRNIPTEIKSRYPQIPWRLMSDMRNVFAHEYFQIDIMRVWLTVFTDLPSLIPQLETLLEQETTEK
ncbi:protein of unknown function DUF86 [Gloeocapsa sp. PCC 7428]|nr:DUF86 domain-containing protein [Gloeocapsa sp. PCC 7428]AFZ28684.1 protein of unknown function DUF86 [Gloeocapsa sp. PCC 7428]